MSAKSRRSRDAAEREDEVRAAGGVLWRPGAGEAEVLLVHRPRYDDWSLPKGKCDPGESFEDCATREVLEETGIHAELEDPLPEVRYRDHKDRPKVVRYWRMRPVDEPDHFRPNDEVDEILWCPLAEAVSRLTYDHDRDLVTALRAS
jgi:8-oxo-dGTP pyrophosphatase MutT (NUDIX family)